jgi:chemotaxis protein CheD
MIALRPEPQPLADVILSVGIGQCVVSQDPSAQLAAYGLGSCVAIAAWDSVAKVAALIHILLPEPLPTMTNPAPLRFALTGVPQFLRDVEAVGGHRARLRVAAAGGAQMFSGSGSVGGLQGIGARNVAVVTKTLQAEGLTLAASDFGGNAGRTLTLTVASGQIQVRTAGGVSHDL